MTHAALASATPPPPATFVSALVNVAMAKGDYELWTFLMVLLGVVVLLFIMLGLTLYVSWVASVALGLLVVAWIAVNTWHELLAKAQQQRARL